VVEERITDGVRIAQLLASELDGRVPGLAVVDADPDVEPTTDGARAYDVVLAAGAGERVARAFVQPDRVRLRVSAGDPAGTVERARDLDLRARPRSAPVATLVFVESGAETARAADLLAATAGVPDVPE
jgi:hypothetical protein